MRSIGHPGSRPRGTPAPARSGLRPPDLESHEKGVRIVRSRPDALPRPPRTSWTAALSVVIVFLLLLGATPRPVRAADPLLTVTKDTLLGAVTGVVLGGTLTLVIEDSGKQSETGRLAMVIGTFGGFVFGVWHATRGDQALFAESEARCPLADKLRLPARGRRAGIGSSATASERPDPGAAFAAHGWSLRYSVLRMSW